MHSNGIRCFDPATRCRVVLLPASQALSDGSDDSGALCVVSCSQVNVVFYLTPVTCTAAGQQIG
jgi:hypothetical protein